MRLKLLLFSVIASALVVFMHVDAAPTCHNCKQQQLQQQQQQQRPRDDDDNMSDSSWDERPLPDHIIKGAKRAVGTGDPWNEKWRPRDDDDNMSVSSIRTLPDHIIEGAKRATSRLCSEFVKIN